MLPLKKQILIAVAWLSMVTNAYADPAETGSQTLVRTIDNGLELQTQLTKNVYKQEAYQDSYVEQVPYTTTEEYYESVPYEVVEPYTDYEYYYESEYRCHSYTDYERRCHMERDCRYNISGGMTALAKAVLGLEASAAEDVRRPGPGRPGPGPHPGPGPGPRPNPPPPPRPNPPPPPPPRPNPPPPPPPPPPRCHDREVCRDVPVERKRCGYEQVRKTREVTRYRTVTRYRQELRRREVVRYREEVRCCVTKYRDVFERQWAVDVRVHFPQDSVLTVRDRETFEIELKGSETNPDIQFIQMQTMFYYQVVDQVFGAGRIDVYLKATPKPVVIDEGVLKDENKISASMRFAGSDQLIKLTDQTPDAVSVLTDYTITVAVKNNYGKTISLGERSFKRSDLRLERDGFYQIPLSEVVRSAFERDQLRRGDRVLVVVEVRRKTDNGLKIQFWKDNWINID